MRRKRRLRRKELKRQKNYLIIGIISLICIFSVGYAAFNTTIGINVTGKTKYRTSSFLKNHTVVTAGDGLYDNGDGTYYYRGANPNNYIEFNNETWRIMSIDSSGNLKIIKDEMMDLIGYSGVDSENTLLGRFDGNGLRTTGYCSLGDAPTNGCNVWSNTYLPSGDYENGVSGEELSIPDDSELEKFLNGNYKTSLQSSEDWQYVKTEMSWNIGPSGYANDLYNIATLVNMEKTYTWTGDIALATKSEYIRANTNSECLTASALFNALGTDTCRTTNYLYKAGYAWWFLSPSAGRTDSILSSTSNGYVSYAISNTYSSVRPVLYLKSNIKITGSGGSTQETMYKIVE